MQDENLIAISGFCKAYNVDKQWISELKEIGLIETLIVDNEEFVPCFIIGKIESYVRLHQDLHINLEGISAISALLDKIEELHLEIKRLKGRQWNDF